jgi:hypothetical protein
VDEAWAETLVGEGPRLQSWVAYEVTAVVLEIEARLRDGVSVLADVEQEDAGDRRDGDRDADHQDDPDDRRDGPVVD